MNARIAPAVLLALVTVFALAPKPAIASGIESDARRLLARRVRASGVDPQRIVFSGVALDGAHAVLSWDAGTQHGFMGLLRRDDRWWDSLEMLRHGACWSSDAEASPSAAFLSASGFDPQFAARAALQNRDVKDALPACRPPVRAPQPEARIEPAGSTMHPVRATTSGYEVTIRYAPNDASADSILARLYVRAPTAAEFAPAVEPPPGWGSSNAFCFFEIEIGGSKPVTFKPGTVMDVWFPFVLDDQLRYDVNYVNGTHASEMIGGSIFDNTLHFVLPAFTLRPGDALMGEIDGNPPR